jgi:hypothetical protein
MQKAGIKTTEFWISVALFLLGIAVFVVDTLSAGGSIAGQIVGGLVSLAGVLGYTVPRAGVKKRDAEAEALKMLGTLGLSRDDHKLPARDHKLPVNPS